ncbi:hypothetical protein CROQUDRAFT_665343 [Cronartium quercuum f. sp. fusiforme G11]|uniref:Uncharacterized protein n=1 Tax=Cronartium quercuum f. sp. fusiforme G11 TaxID=708437 RepID=A0A9P6NAR5_9BASI|nr:hypothetical protein CROQUDRAFT_665343 [Cronartium quercuum f. sp. fusiforme G11]
MVTAASVIILLILTHVHPSRSRPLQEVEPNPKEEIAKDLLAHDGLTLDMMWGWTIDDIPSTGQENDRTPASFNIKDGIFDIPPQREQSLPDKLDYQSREVQPDLSPPAAPPVVDRISSENHHQENDNSSADLISTETVSSLNGRKRLGSSREGLRRINASKRPTMSSFAHEWPIPKKPRTLGSSRGWNSQNVGSESLSLSARLIGDTLDSTRGIGIIPTWARLRTGKKPSFPLNSGEIAFNSGQQGSSAQKTETSRQELLSSQLSTDTQAKRRPKRRKTRPKQRKTRPKRRKTRGTSSWFRVETVKRAAGLVNAAHVNEDRSVFAKLKVPKFFNLKTEYISDEAPQDFNLFKQMFVPKKIPRKNTKAVGLTFSATILANTLEDLMMKFPERARLCKFQAALDAFLKKIRSGSEDNHKTESVAFEIFDLRVRTLLTEAWFVLLCFGEELRLSNEKMFRLQSRSFDVWKALLESEEVNVEALRSSTPDRVEQYRLNGKKGRSRQTSFSNLYQSLINKITLLHATAQFDTLPTRLALGGLENTRASLVGLSEEFDSEFAAYLENSTLAAEKKPDFPVLNRYLKAIYKTETDENRDQPSEGLPAVNSE